MISLADREAEPADHLARPRASSVTDIAADHIYGAIAIPLRAPFAT
ncbi:hypothetical protein [Actinoplanes derwentensis]|uniref:Uncharacterized protein n=1 Tax=Actinoplanes derwentensis TaxID=113562 RepID=A0A1H2DBT4_9ACTN|nr:hypothetical protein [Actinoplanes derwentensis]GID87503.1 hypothetical protein Ade03nite_64270 [Actinoplanes derwentensis]SDT80215.1 hypothetical protein SAMN04489716_9111 [Actinoplanes derwentensis]